MEGDSSIRIPGRWKRNRTAMFNNVLGFSVVECTLVCKIHNVTHLQNETERDDNQDKI